jgi:Flp pilus assembly protein TadD
MTELGKREPRVSQHRRYFRRFRQGCRALAALSAGRLAVTAVILGAAVLSGCAAGARQPTAAPEVGASDSLDKLRERAALGLETRRAAQAKQLYGTILARVPDDPAALTGLGEAEVLLGEHGAALEHSRKAAELAGERTDIKARALQNAGIALLLTNRPEQAEPELEAAVELDPKSWRAWNALGRARDARQAWQEAAAAYERALSLAPGEGAVLNNFGMSKLSAGDHEGAAALFVRALEASPDLAPAETNLRLALALGGRYEEALQGVAAKDMPAALNNAGYAALLRGDFAQARVLFLRAIDASPGFYEPAWSNLQFLGSVEARQSPAPKAP